MLVRPNDRAVDHRIFVIGVGGQMLEDFLPDAGLAPAAEPLMGILPVAQSLRQITPGDAGAVAIEHRLYESTVVFGSHADMAQPPGEQVLDPFPLVVAQSISGHGSAFIEADLPWITQILAEVDSFCGIHYEQDSFYVYPCNN